MRAALHTLRAVLIAAAVMCGALATLSSVALPPARSDFSLSAVPRPPLRERGRITTVIETHSALDVHLRCSNGEPPE